ncbi:hypothetical protein IEQ34_012720 [Dendrobium chrysotoxum]|uniref:Uncharacterized protein n=1 Tax=Dendrobium chrysotoxum TaxID=161865 RepID=A0AAV7GMJ9_DENCH|nr:hypothetical protein IEQ34_012720 [Dendrobium chrysotoxum]
MRRPLKHVNVAQTSSDLPRFWMDGPNCVRSRSKRQMRYTALDRPWFGEICVIDQKINGPDLVFGKSIVVNFDFIGIVFLKFCKAALKFCSSPRAATKPGLEEMRRRIEEKRMRMRMRRVVGGIGDLVAALGLFGEGFLRMEQMKMDVSREMEKMRMEME